MKLKILISLFLLVAFEALATLAVKANLRQIAQQQHLSAAQQVQQFHQSHPLFAGGHYQEMVRAMASKLQTKALNAGKYGKNKQMMHAQQKAASPMPGQQRIKTFREKATDGTAYLGNKLKSLNGRLPAQHVAPAHHGQISELTGKKTNKLKINPALKARLLQTDAPATMSTKPLSKGMPAQDESESAPMGFGARTRSKLNMFNNLNKMAAPAAATGASAGGAGRSARRQNLVPTAAAAPELKTLGSTGRRGKPAYEPEPEYEYAYEYAADPDQSMYKIAFPTSAKSNVVKTLDKKAAPVVSKSKPKQEYMTHDAEQAVKPKDAQAMAAEAAENPNKEHIFIPRKIYRPKASTSKKVNQSEPAGTMTPQPNNEIVQPTSLKNDTTTTTTNTSAPAPTADIAETKSAHVTTVEEAKPFNQTIVQQPEVATEEAEQPETVNQSDTVVELKAAKKVESQEPAHKELIIPLKASKLAGPDSTADEDQIILQALKQEEASPTPVVEQLVQMPPAPAPLALESDHKEIRLLPINLQTLDAQLDVPAQRPQQIDAPLQGLFHPHPLEMPSLAQPLVNHPAQLLPAQEQLVMPQDGQQVMAQESVQEAPAIHQAQPLTFQEEVKAVPMAQPVQISAFEQESVQPLFQAAQQETPAAQQAQPFISAVPMAQPVQISAFEQLARNQQPPFELSQDQQSPEPEALSIAQPQVPTVSEN